MQKHTFTGIVERQVVNKGSKSEHEAIVLRPEGAGPSPLQIRLQGGNPFHDTSLDRFVGKRIIFEAAVSGSVAIVEKLSDISVVAPPVRKPKKNNRPGM